MEHKINDQRRIINYNDTQECIREYRQMSHCGQHSILMSSEAFSSVRQQRPVFFHLGKVWFSQLINKRFHALSYSTCPFSSSFNDDIKYFHIFMTNPLNETKTIDVAPSFHRKFTRPHYSTLIYSTLAYLFIIINAECIMYC